MIYKFNTTKYHKLKLLKKMAVFIDFTKKCMRQYA